MLSKNILGWAILLNIIQQAMEIITRSYRKNLKRALAGTMNFSEMTTRLVKDFRRHMNYTLNVVQILYIPILKPMMSRCRYIGSTAPAGDY
jgi:hypothetical protein